MLHRKWIKSEVGVAFLRRGLLSCRKVAVATVVLSPLYVIPSVVVLAYSIYPALPPSHPRAKELHELPSRRTSSHIP
jgi:hypothetical protein